MITYFDTLSREIQHGDILFCDEGENKMIGVVVVGRDGDIALQIHANGDDRGWVMLDISDDWPINLKFFPKSGDQLVKTYIIGIECLHPERLQKDFIEENFCLETMEEFGFFVETQIPLMRKQMAA